MSFVWSPQEDIVQCFSFCSNCKLNEDAISSEEYSKNLSREGERFWCTVHHTDFMFPTDRFIVDNAATMPLYEEETNGTR